VRQQLADSTAPLRIAAVTAALLALVAPNASADTFASLATPTDVSERDSGEARSTAPSDADFEWPEFDWDFGGGDTLSFEAPDAEAPAKEAAEPTPDGEDPGAVQASEGEPASPTPGLPDFLPFEPIRNARVDKFIHRFRGVERSFFERSVKRGRAHIAMIQRILTEHGVPRELAALALIESGYNPRARSRAGAVGMWQFMPRTGRMYGLERDYWVDMRRDPEKATEAAAQHLRDLYEYYEDWPLALAAYNAGTGRVNRAIRRAGTRDYWRIVQSRWYLVRETRDYVGRFYAALEILTNPERYHFAPLVPEKEEAFEYAEIPDATDLEVISKAAGVGHARIVALNPELRRFCTPPEPSEPYRVRLPAGTGETFAAAFSQIPEDKRVTFRLHKVRRGETPSHIARHYRTSSRVLLDFNGIPSPRHLRAGKTIIVPVRGDGAAPAVHAKAVRKAEPIPAGRTHVVRKGESLWRIAGRYNIDVNHLRRLNGLDGRALLRPGQRITLASARERLSGADARHHAVATGDSVWSIARRYGMTTASLKRCNELGPTAVIHPGQHLKLCDGAANAQQARVHVVSRGDSLWTIARSYAISVEDLLRWNRMSPTSIIHPGDNLVVSGPSGL